MLLIKLSAWFLSPCGLRLCGRLQQQEEGKIDRFIEECAVDPTLRERLTVLSRIFHNKQAKVRGDSMLFSDNIFTVEPVVSDSREPLPSPPPEMRSLGTSLPWLAWERRDQVSSKAGRVGKKSCKKLHKAELLKGCEFTAVGSRVLLCLLGCVGMGQYLALPYLALPSIKWGWEQLPVQPSA